MKYRIACSAALVILALLIPVRTATGGLIFKKNMEKAQAVAQAKGESTAPYSPVAVKKPPSPKMHDLVKVIVLEHTIAEAEGKTDIEKETTLAASIQEFLNFHGRDVTHRGTYPSISGSAGFEMDNQAKTSKKTKLSATIKAEVVEILPNGNLILEAKKERQINEEKETITLTGVIDPDDLDATGCIISDDVAQLRVAYTGRGSVSDGQKRGLLSKVLTYLWPF
jgi:flagellar L-ring protein precursor FlgH